MKNISINYLAKETGLSATTIAKALKGIGTENTYSKIRTLLNKKYKLNLKNADIRNGIYSDFNIIKLLSSSKKTKKIIGINTDFCSSDSYDNACNVNDFYVAL